MQILNPAGRATRAALWIVAMAAITVVALVVFRPLEGADHTDAPGATGDPAADITDVYAFRSPENLDNLETVEALLFTVPELEECIGGNMARMNPRYPVDKTCLATTKRGRRCLHPPLVGRPFCALHGGR